MAPGRAVLLVSVALVWHEVVQGVGPHGHAGEGGGDGGVVREELVGHHRELHERENVMIEEKHGFALNGGHVTHQNFVLE